MEVRASLQPSFSIQPHLFFVAALVPAGGARHAGRGTGMDGWAGLDLDWQERIIQALALMNLPYDSFSHC